MKDGPRIPGRSSHEDTFVWLPADGLAQAAYTSLEPG